MFTLFIIPLFSSFSCLCRVDGSDDVLTLKVGISRVLFQSFRIYEPPKPEKLEPVELCEEVKEHFGYGVIPARAYGLIIAQAVREAVKIAREEREAEKKGEGR